MATTPPQPPPCVLWPAAPGSFSCGTQRALWMSPFPPLLQRQPERQMSCKFSFLPLTSEPPPTVVFVWVSASRARVTAQIWCSSFTFFLFDSRLTKIRLRSSSDIEAFYIDFTPSGSQRWLKSFTRIEIEKSQSNSIVSWKWLKCLRSRTDNETSTRRFTLRRLLHFTLVWSGNLKWCSSVLKLFVWLVFVLRRHCEPQSPFALLFFVLFTDFQEWNKTFKKKTHHVKQRKNQKQNKKKRFCLTCYICIIMFVFRAGPTALSIQQVRVTFWWGIIG